VTETSYKALLEEADALAVRIDDYGHPQHKALEHRKRRTAGEAAADTFASIIGSWRFIIAQSVVLVAWVVLNVVGWVARWDPYPFILLNLMLSFQAAYAGPIIMMSQNRAGDLDRLQAQIDFSLNEKAELEVEQLLTLLRAQIALTEQLREEVAAATRSNAPAPGDEPAPNQELG
jgi:uncharacterized membrane protein